MLSVLIPVYNVPVVEFIEDLRRQCVECNIPHEIICMDDFSSTSFKEENRDLCNMEGVTYMELEKNNGRSRIRNLLAKEAKFEHLLFLDADSKTNDQQFIKRYVDNISSDAVLYGGRNYETLPPKDDGRYFRWWYGRKRETIFWKKRDKTPYHSFMTNNFLIPKTIFMGIQMDESLQDYGHEDTLFGLELKNRKIPILHLDNPLCHIGLEHFDLFIKKTKQGIANLNRLMQKGELLDSIKLVRVYKRVHQFRLDGLVYAIFLRKEQFLLDRMNQRNSSLKWFDFYKLGYLISLNRA